MKDTKDKSPMARSFSSISKKQRKVSQKILSNSIVSYVQEFIFQLQENDAIIPKVFCDNQPFDLDLEMSPTQAQVWFVTSPDGGPKAMRYRLNQIQDEAIVILQELMPKYPFLTDMRFEFCHLSYEQIVFISSIVQHYRQIAHLSLTGNPKKLATDEDCLHLPIQDTHLKMYTVQLCKVDHGIAKLFNYPLAKPDRYTRNLVSLNFGSNKLGDKGCAIITSILRGNRYLQALNIADNNITEKGLLNLFTSLSKFKLSDSELMYKREVKITELKKKYFPAEKKRSSYISHISSASSQTSSGTLDAMLASHPFIIDTFVENDDLYCVGNYTLLHINISFNEITIPVLETVIEAIRYQKQTFKGGGLQRFVAETLKEFPDQMQEIDVLLGVPTQKKNYRASNTTSTN